MGTLIATGSRLVLIVGGVRPQNGELPPIVSSVNVGPRGVARVEAVDEQAISLTALEAGWVDVEVTTSKGRDAVRLEVSDPVRASVRYWADRSDLPSDQEQPWVILKGGSGNFTIHTWDAQGRAQVGWGATPPISADRDAGVVFEEDAPLPINAIQHTTISFHRTGLIELRPLGAAPFLVEVVEPEEIVDLAVVVGDPLDVGELGIAKAMGHTRKHPNRRVVLGGDVVWFSSPTPDVCDVLPPMQHTLGDGAVLVRGKTVGSCEVVAHLGANTVSTRLTVQRGPR